MNRQEQVDRALGSWLAGGPTELSDRSVAAIVDQLDHVKQRRSFRLPERIAIPRLGLVLGGAAVLVLAVVLGLGFYANRPSIIGPAQTPADSPSPSPTPRSPFEGAWVSTSDADGGTQTMTVEATPDGGVSIVVYDDIASVCSLTSSTMTGEGRIAASELLIIATPDYTCDDGSEPHLTNGDLTPMNEVLRNLVYVYDPESDTLSVGDALWHREGAPQPTPGPSTQPAISGSMWPQSSLEEVQQAQEAADVGDPGYAWQVDSRLAAEDPWLVWDGRGELVTRYLREELGWEEFALNPFKGVGNPDGASIEDLAYIRCAPGETNSLYSNDPTSSLDDCAPTLDELRYESVSLDLTQPGKQGATGIWVVSRSALTPPFAQVKPPTAGATALLEDFLQARVDGDSAEGYVTVNGGWEMPGLPLMYATTSGAPYERFEIELVGGPDWPFGNMRFKVRLFAEGGQTVVEQLIKVDNEGGLKLAYSPDGDTSPTTENGEPVAVPHNFFDGQVAMQVLYPWAEYFAVEQGVALNDDGQETLELLSDPLPVGTGCESGPAAADAEELAGAILDDPDLVATTPEVVRLGAIEALVMDVTAAEGASVCTDFPGTQVLTPDDDGGSRGLTLQGNGPMRVYLIDAPEGLSMQVLAIAINAPPAQFESVVDAATPIVESLEFNAP